MSEQRGTAVFYVGTLVAGSGLGMMLYRSIILAGSRPSRWIMLLSIALVGAGALLVRARWKDPPALPLRLTLALLGGGLGFGGMHLLVPSLAEVELVRRQLPGFSFELPRGDAAEQSTEYTAGEITYKQVGGANAIVSVSWSSGALTGQELEAAMKALAPMVGGATPARTTVPGPDGTPVATMSVDTDKGAPLRMTALPCGKRTLYVMSMGVSGIDEVHGRIVRSLVCTPDPAREATPPGLVRLAVDLPGWTASEKLPSQVTIVDPAQNIAVMLREVIGSPVDLRTSLGPLFSAFGGAITTQAPIGDRTPFTGTFGTDHVEGWATQIACTRYGVLVIVLAARMADADAVAPALAKARCLAEGEAPPVWPDAPAAP